MEKITEKRGREREHGKEREMRRDISKTTKIIG